MRKFIGPRILKTGIGVTFALIVSQLLHLNTTFTGVVTLIGMKETIKKTVQYGSTLFAGSILSLIVGFILGTSLGVSPLIFGLGTILIIAILVAFRLVDGLILSVIVMYHVFDAFPMDFYQFVSFSFRELLILIIGILSSIIVNLLAPQKYDQQLKEEIDHYYSILSEYLLSIAKWIKNPEKELPLSLHEFYQHQKDIKRLIKKAEIGIENCFSANSKIQYESYIMKFKAIQKLISIIEDMMLEMKRISGTHLQTYPVSRAMELLAKIQQHPEETTYSTYQRTKVVLNHLNEYFELSPLPETRSEFIDRSSLHHLFLSIYDYLEILTLLHSEKEKEIEKETIQKKWNLGQLISQNLIK
ncbi:aromatic acid exporter family protein [Tepidibacillus sp. LV47]|uniref:aromatic acid exporter family protein n=1 Tax=Tepidibacillus sp. LV47 TaxID=3398228 RepID=UPI003AB03320